MIFVFPMAGLSSRFFDMGYRIPKYQLPLGSGDVFDQVIKPFLKYSENNKFIFICRDVFNTNSYLLNKLKKLRIDDYEIICLKEETSGQAETVYKGLKDVSRNSPIAIFNIDTFHLNYIPIDFNDDYYRDCSGVLEVFSDTGNNWSFARLIGDQVVETAEKKPISNFASNGLYYFESVELYRNSYIKYFRDENNFVNGEKYIAPIYNHLINDGLLIKAKFVERSDLVFCGVPDEYESCKRIFSS